MRGIKYKAYLKDYKMMVDVEFINLKHKEILAKVEGELFEFQLGEYELVQFTGLHDKNGKEIYEGDIVAGYVVKFDEERAGFYPFAKDDGCGCCSGEVVWDSKDIEVIGNIYENPELLEETT